MLLCHLQTIETIRRHTHPGHGNYSHKQSGGCYGDDDDDDEGGVEENKRAARC